MDDSYVTPLSLLGVKKLKDIRTRTINHFFLRAENTRSTSAAKTSDKQSGRCVGIDNYVTRVAEDEKRASLSLSLSTPSPRASFMDSRIKSKRGSKRESERERERERERSTHRLSRPFCAGIYFERGVAAATLVCARELLGLSVS